jgi:hypothetical protein
MAPTISRVAPAPSLQRTRTPRVLLILFDGMSMMSSWQSISTDFVGTWASRLGEMHATIVSELPSLIVKAENIDNGYREGVGTKGGPIEKAFGGEKARSSSSMIILKGYRRSRQRGCDQRP